MGITYSHAYDPLLVAALMVKDEESFIVDTLKPLVQGGIRAFLIFDTGSEDQTVAQARTYLVERGVQFYIEQEPFIDFATSRNRALSLVEEKFPHAAFTLMVDAEWYLQNVQELLAFCTQEAAHPATMKQCYGVRIMSTGLDFYVQRLIANKRGVRFVGVVHEVINQWSGVKVPSDVFFLLQPSQKGREKSAVRRHKDKQLLLREHEKNPQDPRTTFYLAQTCADLGHWDEAVHFYRLRTQQQGFAEENFMALYRLGQALEQCSNVHSNEKEWHDALVAYLAAYALRPQRAEPLVALATHYLQEGNHAMAFLFAQRAVQLPYPQQDILFVEKELYEYTRYNILGICAWYVQEFEIGEQAVLNALKKYPNQPHLYRNMGLYLKRKGFDADLFKYYKSKTK
jgi:hypothetical protein